MIYIIAITVYLLSVWLVWRYMRISHSKGGSWEGLNIGVVELMMVFIPIINTLFMLVFYLLFPPKERKINFNNFFKVKK